MIALPEKPPRPVTETPVLTAIRADLSSLPYVLCFRNNNGALKDERGRLVMYGLGDGSADLVGEVSARFRILPPDDMVNGLRWVCIGVMFAIEVKRPGKMGKRGKIIGKQKPRPDQRTWLELVASRGGITGCADSVEEARAIIARGIERLGGEPWV